MAQFLSSRKCCATCLYFECERTIAKTFTFVKIDTSDVGICMNPTRQSQYVTNMKAVNLCPKYEKLPMLK